jgi:ankyrin repeat protein
VFCFNCSTLFWHTPQACQVLIGYGANPGARDNKGFGPLHYAAWAGHGEVVKRLLAGKPAESEKIINAQGTNGETALHQAVRVSPLPARSLFTLDRMRNLIVLISGGISSAR